MFFNKDKGRAGIVLKFIESFANRQGISDAEKKTLCKVSHWCRLKRGHVPNFLSAANSTYSRACNL